ncbi:MAG TPA: hypothetical protein VKZ51_07550, partial [Cyclobacteriaceae bacterium]|nr:hypothetical protein [Cyclobacteriaceae bacterium]
YHCAILALDTRFNREMLQNGKHGWFFQKDIPSAAEAIDKAETAESDMMQLRSTAVLGLTDKYNWDHVTEKYLELFKELADNKD